MFPGGEKKRHPGHKNGVKPRRKKIKQVLSTITIFIFDVKNILAQVIAHQKRSMQNLKVRKQFMPQKIAQLKI